MTFEEWFEKWWGERTDGPYKSINVESIARAAWEAAQKQEQDPISELKSLWAEYPSLRDEFAMAALPECACEHRYKNDNGETVAKEAYMFADAMLKERKKNDRHTAKTRQTSRTRSKP